MLVECVCLSNAEKKNTPPPLLVTRVAEEKKKVGAAVEISRRYQVHHRIIRLLRA